MPPNPCLGCGACCTCFRVVFHWREADDATPGGVPVALTEDWNSTVRVMRGTAHEPVRCAGLSGTVGRDAKCGIHPHRPSPCREFEASWSEGRHEPRCDAARARYGLPPLVPGDWLDDESPDPGDRPLPRAA